MYTVPSRHPFPPVCQCSIIMMDGGVDVDVDDDDDDMNGWAYLIFVTGTTRKFGHVEKFVHMTDGQVE